MNGEVAGSIPTLIPTKEISHVQEPVRRKKKVKTRSLKAVLIEGHFVVNSHIFQIFFSRFFFNFHIFQFVSPNIETLSVPNILPSVKLSIFGNVSCFS